MLKNSNSSVRLSQKSQIRRRFGAFLSSGTFSASTRQNNVYIRVATLSYLAPRLNSYRYLGIALLKAHCYRITDTLYLDVRLDEFLSLSAIMTHERDRVSVSHSRKFSRSYMYCAMTLYIIYTSLKNFNSRYVTHDAKSYPYRSHNTI